MHARTIQPSGARTRALAPVRVPAWGGRTRVWGRTRARTRVVAASVLCLALVAASSAGGSEAPPRAPRGLLAAGLTARRVTLRWRPGPGGRSAVAYRVYSNGVLVARVRRAEIVLKLAPQHRYRLFVRALDAKGRISAGSRALIVSTPAAPPGVQAFLLASAPDSLADLRSHAAAIEVLYPTYFECALGSARILGADNPTTTHYANALHLALLPRFTCQDGATVHLILSDPGVRAQTLAGLVGIATNPAYAGITLDLENDGAADRGALSAFVATLAARLHALGKRLTVVVDGVTHDNPSSSTGFYDDVALAAVADRVFVLAWGVHWAGSAPGPIAPLPWVQAVAQYVSSLPNAARFVLGVPMYGLDWPAGASATKLATAYQYNGVIALARTVGATPARDPASGEMTFRYARAGVTHEVWYLDAAAVVARVDVARADGLAVGLWRLGSEDQALWSSPAVG